MASDINGHWAQADIQKLADLGVMKGYTDGSFKPGNQITKAEYITLLNRVFGLTASENVSASDLSSSKWYYQEILKAEAADYLFVFNGKVSPDKSLTREEAAAMFGRLLGLPTSTSATSFTDDRSISSWAKPYIPAVAAARIINGYPDGSFHPTETITRAEVARVLNNVCGTFFGAAGTYSFMDSAKENVIVMAPGVTLNGLNIPGNVYISGSVGSGTVTLHNCTVGGEIIAFGNPGATVRFTGTTAKAAVDADGLSIMADGVVNELTVTSDTSRAYVIAGSSGSIEKLNMKTVGAITGTVKHLDVSVSGVTAAQLPEKWTLASGVSVTLAGKLYTTSGTKGPGFASGYPKAEIRQTAGGLSQEIVVTVKLEEPGQIYTIAVPRGSAVPSDEQVKAMANYGMVSISGRNFAAVTTTGVELNLTMGSLPLGTLYDVYVVVESMETQPRLGSAVKLMPSEQLMASGYPKVSALGDNSATVLVKTVAQAQIYMLALPTGSAAPTAQQMSASAAITGAVRVQGAVAGGNEEYLTISGLTKGPAAYDLYVAAAPIGGSVTTEISKFALASTGNSVTVQYSAAAVNGSYPGYTSLTLQFHDKMYKAGTNLEIGAPGAALADLITITGTNLHTGAVSLVTGFTVTNAGSGIVILTPPSGGWSGGMKYTVSLKNITDASGRNPAPSEITFTVGSGAVVAAPAFSLATGSTVTPGTAITAASATPNAVIQYTTDGSDPITGNYQLSYGTTLTLKIPENAINGARYQFRAVARLDTAYSDVVDVWYTVGQNVLEPVVTRADTGALLKASGETLISGTAINVASLDPAAVIYYTHDGSTPFATGIGQKNVQLVVSGQLGQAIVLKFLVVSGSSQSQVFTYTFTIGSANTASTLQTPVVLVGLATSPAVSNASYTVTGTDTLKVYSFNNRSATKLYYTLDGSDPRISGSARQSLTMAAAGAPVELPLSALTIGQQYTLRFVAADETASSFTGLPNYSEVVTVSLTRVS